MIETDFLVIGSGIAGLSFALKAAKSGKVVILTKKAPEESNTRYAQGGIASVMDKTDSFDSHIKDTLTAGAELNDPEAVKLCVTRGPERIRELVKIGVSFSRRPVEEGGGYDLGREGGHSERRILHSGDITGAEVERALLAAVEANSNIETRSFMFAIDLITQKTGSGNSEVLGVYVLDTRKEQIETFVAPIVVIATGGIGKVYLYTSNPDVATGDGIAMAYRAGANISNMEFVQFHPTCLYHPKAKSFLISEALRGEGGTLKRINKTPLMKGVHPMESLAPRDIVARAIDSELKRTGDEHVLLDMTHLTREFIEQRFPNIHQKCLLFGIDMAVDPIPVVPAAHYGCGGIHVGLHGESSIEGLYALGEASFTGLHGANRLASNSLLEAVVYAHEANEHASNLLMQKRAQRFPTIAEWDVGKARSSDEAVVISQNWEEIRRFMWNYVGIVRSTKRLIRAKRRIDMLQREIREYYWDFFVTSDLLELRNIAVVANLIIESALSRRESRGLHFTLDFSDKEDSLFKRPTLLNKKALEGS